MEYRRGIMFSSVQCRDQLSQLDMRDNLAEILLQLFVQEAIMILEYDLLINIEHYL